MASADTIAILPLGATEQHGPHLPLETDTIIADAVAHRAAELLPASIRVEILDAEPVGYSVEHLDFQGTKSLSFQEAINRWIEIGAMQNARGIRKFVLLNAHGGNSPLISIVVTELRVRCSMLAVATSWTRFGWPDQLVAPQEKAFGIHGGLIETSVMLALAPERVDMKRAGHLPSAQIEFARSFKHLRAYGPHAFGWKMGDLNPAGFVGDATAASAELGEKLLDHSARGLAELLVDVAEFDLDLLV